MKIAIVVGTRPEIIKMAPIILECQKRDIPFILIHSNQHYSEDMDSIFFEELNLPAPHYNLNVGVHKGHANQTGNILIKIEDVFKEEKPNVVLVQGDTNTVMASALAASKLGIKLGHVEAGLRSYDRTMPEETNRVLTDHMSDYLFAVSSTQKNILLKEGIDSNSIKVVGNTITDSLYSFIELADEKSQILSELCLIKKEYILFTAHRSSNVDYKDPLTEVVECLEALNEHYPKHRVIWPIHPRAKKMLEEFNLDLPANVTSIGPLGYLDFLALMKNSKCIITDSGGLQEEACILKVPCLTVRENTERPESIEVGGNKLIGRDRNLLIKSMKEFENSSCNWESPFGDGSTASQIIDCITGEQNKTSKKAKRKDLKISILGMGYMGLPMACFLANAGYSVKGIDINLKRVEQINQGDCPFDEIGMENFLNEALNNDFQVQLNIEPSDAYIIAVPTNKVDQKCDLQYVINASESIANVARNGELVILESTVRPKTCEDVILPIFKKKGIDIQLAHCPERAIPGNSLFEMENNDRIIGAINSDSLKKTKEIYSSFVKGNIFETTITTAEVAKLMENTFRDINIAFANELHSIMDQLDVDVFEAIRLANKHPRVNILTPGTGVGGHCIAVDPWFLTENVESSELIKIARKINDNKPKFIVDLILREFEGKKIGALGLAYKNNVDDCRESPSFIVIEILKEKGFEVKVFDPFRLDLSDFKSIEELEDWSDCSVVLTGHDQFKEHHFKKKVIDPASLL